MRAGGVRAALHISSHRTRLQSVSALPFPKTMSAVARSQIGCLGTKCFKLSEGKELSLTFKVNASICSKCLCKPALTLRHRHGKLNVNWE